MEQQSAAPPQARNVVNFLRNKAGIKTKVGVLNGKRVDYFKGSAAVKAVLSPAYQKLKDVPEIKDEAQAQEELHRIIPYAFFLRVDKGASSGGKDAPKVININQQQMFKSELYYAWFYEGSQLALKLGGLGMVAVMLAGVMFPLWPPMMRLGVWYLSIGVLGLIGLFFGIAIVRLIFWIISLVILRPGIWIFPNLFEDVGFVDSFIPLWAWDVPPPKKEKRAKKVKSSGSKEKSGKQQAIARAQAPKAPEASAPSQPASQREGVTTGPGGPGASDNLDDIN
ncbi:translocation protein [Violaceomyces palustris]|uniref:Translocation protein n=1 Tax=Violaceomyces palustris TaxID=1673888 RepID=A0ACD0NSD7_9BASI|nr:translocation protein [Violaceomyces palustris]